MESNTFWTQISSSLPFCFHVDTNILIRYPFNNARNDDRKDRREGSSYDREYEVRKGSEREDPRVEQRSVKEKKDDTEIKEK